VIENPLSAWENFYIIVGSSAAALIGLQFVVITLIADRRPLLSAAALSAFGTPTVVHLGGALVVSAVMSAPWPTLGGVGTSVGFCGGAGILYTVITTRRALRQTTYKPVMEDWLWHILFPGTIYVTLAIVSPLLAAGSQVAYFVAGGAALGLLLIGIHNAWDTVTYVVLIEPETARSTAPPPATPKTDGATAPAPPKESIPH